MSIPPAPSAPALPEPPGCCDRCGWVWTALCADGAWSIPPDGLLAEGCITDCVADGSWQATGDPCVYTQRVCTDQCGTSCDPPPAPPGFDGLPTPGCCAPPPGIPCTDCTGAQPDATLASSEACAPSAGTYTFSGYTNLGGGNCQWSWFFAPTGASIVVVYVGGVYYASGCGVDGGATWPLSCVGGVITGTITGTPGSGTVITLG